MLNYDLRLQSNLDNMPPVGTEQKWHSIESGIVVRVCKSGLIFLKKCIYSKKAD